VTSLIALDPGNAKAKRRICYLAHFDASELIKITGMAYGSRLREDPQDCVIEKPQQDGRSGRVPPGVLIDLAWNGALVAGSLRPQHLHCYTPDYWKGQVSKPVHHLKIWRVLEQHERECFPADTEARIQKGVEATARAGGKLRSYSFEAHNWLDAVGLGLFHLKRIGKGGAKIK
jgi:hypothetical protein